MKTTTLQLGFFGLLLTLSVAAPWQIWHLALLRARATDPEIQRQAAGLEELSAGNTRLSNLVAEAAKNSLSMEQFHELIRLRGEMGTLRQTADEVEKIRARNERARSQLADAAALPPPPVPQNAQAYWPKTQLVMAGYADPVAAVQTTLWAMSRNDPGALEISVTPGTKSKLTAENWRIHGPPAEEVARATQQIADSLNPDTGFYVIGQEPGRNQDEATVKVYFDGEGRTRPFLMQRIAGEWKFASLGGAWP